MIVSPSATPRLAVLIVTFGLLACDPPQEGHSGEGHAGGSVTDVLTVDGPPACADCTIEFEVVVELGQSSDPASIREDAAVRGCMVAPMGDDQFAVSGTVGGGAILVYDSGSGVARTIGREGQGPGEFGAMLRLVLGANDSLFVVDDSQARLQVFTPLGEFVRSFPIPALGRDFALLANGGFVFSATARAAGDPLMYILDRSGDLRKGFGETRMTDPQEEAWLVSPAPKGGFWTASVWRYELHRRNEDGDLIRTLRREVDWFPPYQASSMPTGIYETVPPPPFLLHAWEDADGFVWAYSLVPDADWQPGIPLQPSVAEWARRTFDMVVEVIDTQSGDVMVETRVERMGRVCGSSMMYEVIETPEGDTRARILQPVLNR